MDVSKMGFGKSLASFIGDINRAQAAASTYATLDAMSDDALASRGLARTDIARQALKHLVDG
jgi:uncharacterized protein YjiS (DUF1127 family)